ncbi:MAG: Gfo/Idh/MocA family oxidoreductase [Hyphomicrobiales bacterium]|nr:Gfo/Idh/MocA family oxidoreductase [Hyphomicrobiales bacterium]
MANNGKLRFGVLGAANIARQFVAGCAPSSDVEATAVASREIGKAERFAKEVGVARALGSYEALLADPDIDAIYNPLPNSLHAEWSIRAAEAGKHVLCEKPLAMDAGEARAMFAAADRNGVVLREAYPYLAQQQTAIMRRWIADGAIGKVRLVRATFSVFFEDPANIRLIPSLGGGALYDAGSYAVSLVRIAAGVRPARVQALAQYDGNGVDRTTLASMAFSDGAMAQISCSFATAFHRSASIGGDKGVIETNYLNHPPNSGPALLQIRRSVAIGAPLEPVAVPDGNGFRLEAESFARLVRGDAQGWTGATPEESVDIAMMMDAIRASARDGGKMTEV